MARVVILGCAGSGKTTLARQLAERTGAPLISLDEIWQAHGTESNVPLFRSLIESAHSGNEWISEGNFALATFDIRMPRATLVVWLEHPRLFCAWGVITRVIRRGESHRIGNLGKVLAFIWRFNRINRPRIEASRISHGPHVPVRRLSSRDDIASFLSFYPSDANWPSST